MRAIATSVIAEVMNPSFLATSVTCTDLGVSNSPARNEMHEKHTIDEVMRNSVAYLRSTQVAALGSTQVTNLGCTQVATLGSTQVADVSSNSSLDSQMFNVETREMF